MSRHAAGADHHQPLWGRWSGRAQRGGVWEQLCRAPWYRGVGSWVFQPHYHRDDSMLPGSSSCGQAPHQAVPSRLALGSVWSAGSNASSRDHAGSQSGPVLSTLSPEATGCNASPISPRAPEGPQYRRNISCYLTKSESGASVNPTTECQRAHALQRHSASPSTSLEQEMLTV
jgi:hypothetical protein